MRTWWPPLFVMLVAIRFMADPSCRVTPSTAFPVITAEFRLTMLCKEARIPFPALFWILTLSFASAGKAVKVPPNLINTPSDPFPVIRPPSTFAEPTPTFRPALVLF